MGLRIHQQEMKDICQKIKNGEHIKDIFCDICPAAGKTGMALVAFNELVGTVVDTCVVIVPRDSLKYQFEKDCMDKRFYTGKLLRAAENGENMARGVSGYITTYQSVAAKPLLHVEQLKGKKYMVICDELHHLIDKASWGDSVYPLLENATVTVQMSGTFETNNGFIKTVPYKDNVVDKNTGTWITYNREQALKDGVILPIDFKLFDCGVDIEHNGKRKSYKSLGSDSKALCAALKSSFKLDILKECMNDFVEYKKDHAFAKMLTIDSTIKEAERTVKFLQSHGLQAEIAHSQLDKCSDIVKEFKGDKDVLCTVGIAYEGLNVPPVTYGCLLTKIRSKSWVNQAIGRFQRCYEGKDRGFVYAPKDDNLKQVITDIQNCTINESKERQVQNSESEDSGYVKPDENKYYAFLTDVEVISDIKTISEMEKEYRSIIHKRIEKWVFAKSFIFVGKDLKKTRQYEMIRRQTAYRYIKKKFNVKSVKDLDVLQLSQAIIDLERFLTLK